MVSNDTFIDYSQNNDNLLNNITHINIDEFMNNNNHSPERFRFMSHRSNRNTPVYLSDFNTSRSSTPERKKPARGFVFSHPQGEDISSVPGFECIICFKNKPRIFPNCGHVCLCIQCSKNIVDTTGKCPICRSSWYNLKKMYFP